MKTRNSEALESFVLYCENNPDQRFWQALRNWSKYDQILGHVGNILDKDLEGMENTFYLEDFDGTRK